MILDDVQAQAVLKANRKTPQFVLDGRDLANKLFALLHGDNFIALLIEKIEYIESANKAEARKKYSRDVVHFFTRLLRPISNVYSANGGSISIDLEEEERKELLSKISRVRDGKSLRDWLKTFWMPLYHSDPNGVIFIEYTTTPELDCWPTYKQIDSIRAYKPKGQLVDWIQFEPKKELINGEVKQTVRLVDDVTDRTYIMESDAFILQSSINGVLRTFEHPFGQVPAVINSDLQDLRNSNLRLSPVDPVIPIAKEYARDQSVKSIYKLRMGIPREWKISDQCITCQGSGKHDDSECKECDGHGYYQSKDITDVTEIAPPEKNEPVLKGDDMGGFITPPVEVLQEFRIELEELSKGAHATQWGTMAGFTTQVQKTATEVFFDTQPMSDKLNDYGDVAEVIENQIIEWIANLLFESKPKDERISSNTLGRRYIIDSPDVILEKYQQAKKEGDNNVILDRLYSELQTSKYKRDPEFLRIILLKSTVEPYLHLNLEQIEKTFGVVEAQKKVLFKDWWEILDSNDKDKDAEALTADFNKWFEDQQPKDDGEGNAATLAAQAELRGSVGGATVIKDLIAAVSANQVPKASAIQILINLFGYTEKVSTLVIGTPVITIPTKPTGGGGDN